MAEKLMFSNANFHLDGEIKLTMKRMGVQFDGKGIICWPTDILRELAPEKGSGYGLVDSRAWYRLFNAKGSFIIGISDGLSGQYVAGIFPVVPGRLEHDINTKG